MYLAVCDLTRTKSKLLKNVQGQIKKTVSTDYKGFAVINKY